MCEVLIKTVAVNKKKINIYGIYDSIIDFESGKAPEFYDVFEEDENGQTCLNEGEMFWEFPNKDEIRKLIKDFYKS